MISDDGQCHICALLWVGRAFLLGSTVTSLLCRSVPASWRRDPRKQAAGGWRFRDRTPPPPPPPPHILDSRSSTLCRPFSGARRLRFPTPSQDSCIPKALRPKPSKPPQPLSALILSHSPSRSPQTLDPGAEALPRSPRPSCRGRGLWAALLGACPGSSRAGVPGFGFGV